MSKNLQIITGLNTLDISLYLKPLLNNFKIIVFVSSVMSYHLVSIVNKWQPKAEGDACTSKNLRKTCTIVLEIILLHGKMCLYRKFYFHKLGIKNWVIW